MQSELLAAAKRLQKVAENNGDVYSVYGMPGPQKTPTQKWIADKNLVVAAFLYTSIRRS